MTWGQDTDFITYDGYDLFVFSEYGNIVTKSEKLQEATSFGVEACKFRPIPGIKYYLGIYRYWARAHDITILIGVDGIASLEEYSSEKNS
jgi:hypothetical protein